ncbi:MAG: hypothetical protein ABIJ16_08745, partial [Bacteroidota bacterium]
GYREKYGKMLSLYELQLIEGFEKDDIERLLPFVTIDQEADRGFSIPAALKYGKHQVFIRGRQILEEQKGFSDISDSLLRENINARYMGSPMKIYTRYKYQYKNKLLWGMTAEKDAGEPFLTGNLNDTVRQYLGNRLKNGFDFYSGHLQVNDVGIFKKIVLGDYQLQFGQGLTAWSGLSYGKSSFVSGIRKKAQGLRKYSSTDENMFLRGAGATVSVKDIDLTGFFSWKKIDANVAVYDTIADEVLEVSSILNTGLHATPGELEDKHILDEMIYGGNATFSKMHYKLGATFITYNFSSPLNKDLQPYNSYVFNGQSNFNAGVDYQINYNKLNFFGEAALSENGGMAFINGAVIRMHSQLSLAILHRWYEKDYQALYCNPFAEGSGGSNEHGLYIGTEIYPVKRWKLSAYYDNFTFPWLRYRVDAPSGGYEYFLQADYSPKRSVQMHWRIKKESKPQNFSTDTIVTVTDLADVSTTKMRFHIRYSISDQLEMRDRIELANYTKDTVNDHGYLVYHDIVYKPENLPISLTFRYAVFDTDSWDARIYAFESDVLYAFSIPAFSDKGFRTYLLLNYKPVKGVDIWIRYALTSYIGKDIIGSGMTEIQGNKKSEIQAQVRFSF